MSKTCTLVPHLSIAGALLNHRPLHFPTFDSFRPYRRTGDAHKHDSVVIFRESSQWFEQNFLPPGAIHVQAI
jgi:hypothetical protein